MSLIIPAQSTTSDSAEVESTSSLLSKYQAVRRQTETLAEPLEAEDFVVQSMPDASPIKWHLAHTTWFFETFLLSSSCPDYRPRFPQYNFLFNSYYNTIGERISRDRRGLLSRPTIAEVRRYRSEIDTRMEEWIDSLDETSLAPVSSILTLGFHHEQQHQELILTDLKHAFASNPLRPIYREREPDPLGEAAPISWIPFEAGVQPIGHQGGEFAFDNETPRHLEYLQAFELANRPSTNGEFLRFMEAGGYDQPEFWLSDGWAARRRLSWTSPLYWEESGGRWTTMTLAGMTDVRLDEPVTHLSFYEADAFARWSGARLATEAEWEVACGDRPVAGQFMETGRYHPAPTPSDQSGLTQMFGDVWEWTQSPYTPYPGYRPASGALGEYNGKFMCNQIVLRGGSCASPSSHLRSTYRNFFGPESRWQFTGVRLARDLG